MRIRVSYIKDKPLRFTSALDIQSIWERSFRRAGFQISYSEGFHPKPKIQLGFPLPLGFISEGEVVDIWLDDEISLNGLRIILQTKVPDGISITNIEEIALDEKPLTTFISYSDYRVFLWDQTFSVNILEEKIAHLKNSAALMRTKRNGKTYDLRPLICNISIDFEEDRISIFMKLITRQDKMGRPDEVMKTLGFDLSDFLVQKICSY